MKRGEVWLVRFSSGVGGEIQKNRPAIIVSNNASNKFLNRVQVVPVTSSTRRLYPSEALVKIGNKRGKAMADQITTLSKNRLHRPIGTISNKELKQLEQAIKIQLGLSK